MLVAIADNAVIAERDIVTCCQRAQSGGATAIQLRIKTVATGSFLALAEKVVESLDVPVFINDRVDVAVLAGAFGAHLGAGDLSIKDARRVGGNTLCLGASVGCETEARVASGSGANYWGVGPVFRTSSKSDAGPALGIAGFEQLRQSAIAASGDSNVHSLLGQMDGLALPEFDIEDCSQRALDARRSAAVQRQNCNAEMAAALDDYQRRLEHAATHLRAWTAEQEQSRQATETVAQARNDDSAAKPANPHNWSNIAD